MNLLLSEICEHGENGPHMVGGETSFHYDYPWLCSDWKTGWWCEVDLVFRASSRRCIERFKDRPWALKRGHENCWWGEQFIGRPVSST